MSNFWTNLKKPIYCLAPMEGVTDTVFRQLIYRLGPPDVFFTEFVNVQSIFSHDQTSLVHTFKTCSKIKTPLVAQIWGLVPELFEASARLITNLGFSGLDLNFGCPQKKVIKKGACSALIKDRSLCTDIIQSTQKGLAGKIPISFKIRLGFEKLETEDWVSFLLKFKPAALIIHGRTTKEMSTAPVHWQEIKKAVQIKKALSPTTLVIGNGDLFSLSQAQQQIKFSGVDGVMIGRGALKDPFIFNPHQHLGSLSAAEKISLLLDHLKLFDQTWQGTKPFHLMKRFFKIYLNGFPGALSLRTQLMTLNSSDEAKTVLFPFLK